MSYKITSRFLQQESFRKSGHSGIDFAMPDHTPLRSIEDGVVERVINYGNQNAGKTVIVRWEDGKQAIYGHMSEFAVEKGDVVKAGDLLGYSGNSGHVVGSNGGYHLHFGLKGESGKFIDPSPYIDKIQNMNTGKLNEILINKKQIIKHRMTFEDFSNMQAEIFSTLQDIKLNFINFLLSIDYAVFIQHIQNVLQFFS